MTPHPVADSLLVHASFVQRLARGLAGRDGDDLAQDAWVQALAADPSDLRSERGWLAAVLGNLWRNRTRAAVRRRQREAAAAASAAREDASVPDILEREEARAHVVAAVLELPEALRRVVLLRFYDGLDSSAIGERLQLAPSTVRAQLQRALDELRRHLDAKHGGRRDAWAIPFARWFGNTLRVTWPARSAVGAVAAVLLAWLTAPLWLGSPPALPTPLGAADPASAARRDEHAALADAAAREAPILAAAVDEARTPEDFWGRVVAASGGAPIANAAVALEHRDGDEMMNLDLEYGQRAERIGSTSTDAEGRFRFKVQRATQNRLTVRASGFAPVMLTQCTGGSEYIVRLDRPGWAEGVVRRTDGTPLADVLVEGFERDNMGNGASARTGPDGAFFLPDLPPRPCHFRVHATGLEEPDWPLREIAPGAGVRVEFTLAEGRRVHGVVRDQETGAAIGGAVVANSWTMKPAVRSAPDGTYVFAGVGRDTTLYVRADGYADLASEIPKGDDVTLDVMLDRGKSVLGKIVDREHRPIANTFVAAAATQFLLNQDVHVNWRTGVVARDGSFRLEGLAAAGRQNLVELRWHVLVRAPGFGARVLAIPSRSSLAGPIELGEIELGPQAWLEGRFVSATTALVRAEVTLSGTPNGVDALMPPGNASTGAPHHFVHRETRTGSDGTFRFAGLAPGSYNVSARVDGKDWSVEVGPFTVVEGEVFRAPDLVADRGLTIEGRVRAGAGVGTFERRDLELCAMPEGGGFHHAELAADSTFCFERLPAGKYRIYALRAPAGCALLPHESATAGARGLELALVPAETIEGTVVDRDGKPAPGVDVCFFEAGASAAHNHFADANGRFRIEVAPGATGRVCAGMKDNPFHSAQRDATAGNKDVVLKLP